MKVSILQEDLTKALSVVSRSVAPKATLPILANILISTDKGRLKLSSTNLEIGVNFWIGGKIEKEGAITIPARALTEFVSSLPAGKVDLEVSETTLSVNSNSYKAKFNGMAADEFPHLPRFTGQEILTLEKNNLPKILSQVIFAASFDEGRPVLTGVLIKNLGGKISLVATDGYRLSLREIAVPASDFKQDFLIPAKTLLEVSRVSQDSRGEEENIKVGLASEKSQIIFTFSDIEISSRLIEGDFPDWTKIIPTSSSTRATFDKEDFLRAVKMASIFAREQANIVKVKIESENLRISAETPQLGTNESEVEAKVEGEGLEVAFNCRFLLDYLSNVSEEEIVLETNDPLSPGVFKSKTDPSWTHIIMPVRIQD